MVDFVDENLWKDGRGVRWDKEDIKMLLDKAELALRETSDALRLKVDILRKERSIGMVNKSGVSARASLFVSRLATLFNPNCVCMHTEKVCL